MKTMAFLGTYHIQYVLLALIISVAFLVVALPFNKYKYGKFFGYSILGIKALDILVRIFIEKYPPYESIPLHLCNVSIIFVGVYLITRNKYLLAVPYMWTYGALIVLIIPSGFNFVSHYPLLYFLTHSIILAGVFYGVRYYGHRLNLKMFIFAIVMYFVLIVVAHFVNIKLGTNFMYVEDFILPVLKPLGMKLYLIIFIPLNILCMYLTYYISRKIRRK